MSADRPDLRPPGRCRQAQSLTPNQAATCAPPPWAAVTPSNRAGRHPGSSAWPPLGRSRWPSSNLGTGRWGVLGPPAFLILIFTTLGGRRSGVIVPDLGPLLFEGVRSGTFETERSRPAAPGHAHFSVYSRDAQRPDIRPLRCAGVVRPLCSSSQGPGGTRDFLFTSAEINALSRSSALSSQQGARRGPELRTVRSARRM
jgi:hypothetical protein